MERARSASKENVSEMEEPASPASASQSPSNQLPSVTRSAVETEEERAINYGPYREKYATLHSIGKGAFGFVKLALRRHDMKEVP